MPEAFPKSREIAEQRHSNGAGDEKPRRPCGAGIISEEHNGHREREIEKRNPEEGDMAEPHHPPGPGSIAAQPTGAVEEEALYGAGETSKEDADPGGGNVEG